MGVVQAKAELLSITCLTDNNVNIHYSDTMDSVKQSAALCLLRLYKTSPDLVLMGEWTSRVVHLLNDQHMVNTHIYRHVNIQLHICMFMYVNVFFFFISAFISRM